MGQADQAPAPRARTRGKQGGLLFLPLGFVAVTTAFAVFGVWEIFRAREANGTRMPIVPVMTGTVAMPFVAYLGGIESLMFAMLASSVAVLLWRSIESAAGSANSIFAGVFTLGWVPFFISFAALPLHATEGASPLGLWPDGTIPEGAWQVAVMLLLVVSNDTFGYLVGASLAPHGPENQPQEVLGRFRRLRGRGGPDRDPRLPVHFGQNLVGRRCPGRGYRGGLHGR